MQLLVVLFIMRYFTIIGASGIAQFFQLSTKRAKNEVTSAESASSSEVLPSCSGVKEQVDTACSLLSMLPNLNDNEQFAAVDLMPEESASNDDDNTDESDSDDDLLGPPVDTSTIQVQPQLPAGPNDLSQSPNDGPTQPYLRKYPGHIIGNTERRFNYKLFKLYDWLEYSRVTDSVYCFCCRHFRLASRVDRVNDTFTNIGFRAWNRGGGGDPKTNAFLLHKNSDEHRCAVERYAAYKQMALSGKTVVNMLDNEHRK